MFSQNRSPRLGKARKMEHGKGRSCGQSGFRQRLNGDWLVGYRKPGSVAGEAPPVVKARPNEGQLRYGRHPPFP